jgi:hypothetical protein
MNADLPEDILDRGAASEVRQRNDCPETKARGFLAKLSRLIKSGVQLEGD